MTTMKTRKKMRTTNRGFTLIELIIVLTISAIIGSIIYSSVVV